MADKKGDDKEQKRAQRATSNVFAMFSQPQIQEFKEAFTMIDQNRDGFIDIEDMKDMYASLGMTPDDASLKKMLAEAPGQMNFTVFLNMFGENLHGTDPEQAIKDAFAMFDEEGKGTIPEDYMKDLLLNMGDNFSDQELKKMWQEAPIVGDKEFDYMAYTTLVKRGKQEEMAA